ncbi:MAG TPA: 2-hydroxychromene-2-carboxylate isomerase [Kofleriaceae bacterium]|nr:2-hydroxychromene-2-carboxylate isomerase [Kofleriaceae bacterium]
MARLDFWCELASPYTYLAAVRIEALADAAGVELGWQPFLLGPIFAAAGWPTSPFEIYPDKGRHMWRDVAREAAALGVALQRPSQFPRNSVAAARVARLGVERGWGPAFIRAALAANFAGDRDIAAPEVIDDLLAGLGLDGPALRAEADGPAHRPALRAATERAVALHIFGAPSFVVGDELFWGNDRLERALAWARGDRPA